MIENIGKSHHMPTVSYQNPTSIKFDQKIQDCRIAILIIVPQDSVRTPQAAPQAPPQIPQRTPRVPAIQKLMKIRTF